MKGNDFLNKEGAIRQAVASEPETILEFERLAFGSDEESTLVRNLANDKSTAPFVLLLAL